MDEPRMALLLEEEEVQVFIRKMAITHFYPPRDLDGLNVFLQ